jgi:nitroreductase
MNRATHAPTPLSAEETRLVLRAATAAPSVLNTQPWAFRMQRQPQGEVFDVHADFSRLLPHTDPYGRELSISCGAAVCNIQLALRHLGRDSTVTILPVRDDRRHLARVEVTGARPPTDEEEALVAAIPRRRTNRYPFTDQPLPDRLIAELEESAAGHGAVLRVLTSDEAARLAEAIHDADALQAADPATQSEITTWVGGLESGADGIPPDNRGPRPEDPRTVVREFTARDDPSARPTATFESRSTLALLSTIGDEPADWIACGRVLQRVLLLATVRGLAVSFLTQVMEREETRWRAFEPSLRRAHVQMVLRIGYPRDGSPVPATPRRPVEGVTTWESTPPDAHLGKGRKGVEPDHGAGSQTGPPPSRPA